MSDELIAGTKEELGTRSEELKIVGGLGLAASPAKLPQAGKWGEEGAACGGNDATAVRS